VPNGKIGDHPLSDIIVHREEVFGDRIDGLIRELARFTSMQRLYKMFDWFDPPPLSEFEMQLEEALRLARSSIWN
jgi:hypothetical protein